MKRRVLAGLLWFLAAWYAWSIFATFAGLSDIAGPILGVAAGLLFAVDPLNRIWTPPAAGQAQGEAPAFAEPA
jgi:hypothetical protein